MKRHREPPRPAGRYRAEFRVTLHGNDKRALGTAVRTLAREMKYRRLPSSVHRLSIGYGVPTAPYREGD